MSYDNLTEALFSLSDKAGLSDFCADLDVRDPFSRALRARAMMWLERRSDSPDDSFHPGQFLSADLSAIIYGLSPTIFMGSNNWALKRDLSEEELTAKVAYFSYRMKFLAENNSNKFCFVVVPEKDIIMDNLAGRSHLIRSINSAISTLSDACIRERQPFVYDGFVSKLPIWASEDEYEYADSHLLSRDYFMIFVEILTKLGFNPIDAMGEYSFYMSIYYGDLNEKFWEPLYQRQRFLLPRFKAGEADLVGGSKTFESPLGQTFQVFKNENAKVNLKVAIYGDSHSSVAFQKRFTYMFAATFKHCEFYWIPWGGIPEDFNSDADIVIMEIAQRFVFT